MKQANPIKLSQPHTHTYTRIGWTDEERKTLKAKRQGRREGWTEGQTDSMDGRTAWRTMRERHTRTSARRASGVDGRIDVEIEERSGWSCYARLTWQFPVGRGNGFLQEIWVIQSSPDANQPFRLNFLKHPTNL